MRNKIHQAATKPFPPVEAHCTTTVSVFPPPEPTPFLATSKPRASTKPKWQKMSMPRTRRYEAVAAAAMDRPYRSVHGMKTAGRTRKTASMARRAVIEARRREAMRRRVNETLRPEDVSSRSSTREESRTYPPRKP
ncbi:hypothetical protein AAT19DRAFT_9932 [Rhodotorula toruloides]|uniref:Uncharacterized protein n=1 Tax=Rhodotorula toruloides TaxID=5286 RepID=A0A2T0A1C9_RHOTO|nr:hypothetical protein AAT19DRAFT_9932 [Rhodotorula toruloides]